MENCKEFQYKVMIGKNFNKREKTKFSPKLLKKCFFLFLFFKHVLSSFDVLCKKTKREKMK